MEVPTQISSLMGFFASLFMNSISGFLNEQKYKLINLRCVAFPCGL